MCPKLANARAELDTLARDIWGLSTMLELPGDVRKRHESCRVEKTMKIVDRLVNRCENVLEELKVAAELVNSKSGRLRWLYHKPKIMEHKLNLEGFKSNLLLSMQTLSLAKVMEQQSVRQCFQIGSMTCLFCAGRSKQISARSLRGPSETSICFAAPS
jgi:hypothetical protein